MFSNRHMHPVVLPLSILYPANRSADPVDSAFHNALPWGRASEFTSKLLENAAHPRRPPDPVGAMPLRPKPTTRKERLDNRSAVPTVAAMIKSTGFFAQHQAAEAGLERFCAEQPEDNHLHVYPEIDIDTKLPSREAFIAFTTHQALTSKGRISKYSARDTIRSLMGSFGIWRREALKPVPFEYTQQVYTYIDSEQLAEIVPLCTDSKPRHSMSATDFEVLARALFKDNGFRTLRMDNGTNEALTWGEHDFHVIPNEDDPHHPLIIIVVKISRQKGYGGKKSVYKEFVLYPEPNTNCPMCPVTQAVALAMEDQIFADITSAEQIFSPQDTADGPPRLDPEARIALPVCSTGRGLAQRRLGHFFSFRPCLDLYRIQRPFTTRQFGRWFMSPQGKEDAFLINLTSMRAVSSMSACRDNNAPVELPLEHVGLITNEPELVDMRRAREKLAKEISETSELLVSTGVDEEKQKQ
ncbi:hypothetical protein ARMGADRAFT_1090810 [Armillaria gallica]|uniref:Uncharacterized protein n=1 Tax=Armillaria gallica TaxID=47427 RepID=A0A2H3CFW5_ARMGA|nr:hypothetical protein ARMGADRAFT_1090806 [Armillaria gallica]PBK81955.1 hypothetical protein ARMGADRAFT_1090810 [Armillaria gallica]